MIRAKQALVVLFVATFGLWGCTQGPANSFERLRTVEAKNAQLEEELRAATTARDQLKKELASVKAERTRQADQLLVLQKEKDDLQAQLTARIGERNAVQAQYEQFRSGLKDLLGRAEAGLSGAPVPPVTSTTTAADSFHGRSSRISIVACCRSRATMRLYSRSHTSFLILLRIVVCSLSSSGSTPA